MGHLYRVDGAPQMKWRAVRMSLLMSLLFVVVYPTCNWLASQRANVGTWFFPWELQIPFIPWMIIPYWSIDVFFVCAPFVCLDRAELRVLGQRITFAILAAGLCFLAFPLQIAFPRPAVTGILGAMFNFLRAFDQPHNLFPSLHIALLLILRSTYSRHTRGLVQWATNIWFLLIGLSAVFTWQHQVIDVVGGAALGTLCFYLFRETPLVLPVVRNYRVASYYAIVGVFTAWIGGIMWWPTMSLAVMTAAYLGLGPGVFRKERGRLPLSARIVLGPVLFGQWLSLQYYRRQCRAWDEVVPGVLIGRVLSNGEAASIRATAVLDLTGEFTEAKPFLALTYRNIPVLDLTAPTPEQLREAVAFVTDHAGKGPVYVHCKIGYSRSAAVVGAYLMATSISKTTEDVAAMLRSARPSIVVRPEVLVALRQFAESV